MTAPTLLRPYAYVLSSWQYIPPSAHERSKLPLTGSILQQTDQRMTHIDHLFQAGPEQIGRGGCFSGTYFARIWFDLPLILQYKPPESNFKYLFILIFFAFSEKTK